MEFQHLKHKKSHPKSGWLSYTAIETYNLSFALIQFKSSKATFKRATNASSDLRNQTRGS